MKKNHATNGLPEIPDIAEDPTLEPPARRLFAPLRTPTKRQELRVKLAAAEWNMLASLLLHYDMPATHIIRMLIREAYMELHIRTPKIGGSEDA